MSTHTCPGQGCTVQVKREQLTCKRHWFSLPADLRARLNSAYRSNDGVAHSLALADCMEFFRTEVVG